METRKITVTLWDGDTKIEANPHDYVVQYYAGGWQSEAVFNEFLKAEACRKDLETHGCKYTQIVQLY